jgi:hypothetical protein
LACVINEKFSEVNERGGSCLWLILNNFRCQNNLWRENGISLYGYILLFGRETDTLSAFFAIPTEVQADVKESAERPELT